MTKDDVRAAAKRLVQFHERFAPSFGKDQAQDNAFTYIKGLMICPERKSIEPIALNVGKGNVSAMQKFINSGPWDHEDIQADLQHVFAKELVPTAADSPIGVVGVVDESAFTKKGDKSAGVARQHNGRLGKEDNCQVGVFLTAVTPGGAALLEHQLFLPEHWCQQTQESKERRNAAHVPPGIEFRTKPQIAAHLIRAVAVLDSVQLDWVVADELYGRSGRFLDELEALNQNYVVEVPVTTHVWTTDPTLSVPAYSGRGRIPTRPAPGSSLSVKEVGASLPAAAWRTLLVAQGAKGPLAFDFAAVPIWQKRHDKPGPQGWLMIRRSLDPTPEIKHYISNAAETTQLEVLAQVGCTRFRVEEFLEDSKTYLGMTQYETRSWTGWHHHMSLVALAHLFVTLVRRDLRKETPALTLDRTIRLLKSAMKLPHLDEDHALRLVDYYIRRNEIAQKSHEKTWMACRPNVKLLPL
jgi:SRSO17 transposase